MIPAHTPPPPPAFSKSKTNVRSAVVQREIEKLHDSATVGVNQSLLHIDDLSSDDEDGNNTIGRVPLHWYDEYEHIGYDTTGDKVMKGGGENPSEDGVEDIFKSLDEKVRMSGCWSEATAKATSRLPTSLTTFACRFAPRTPHLSSPLGTRTSSPSTTPSTGKR